MYASGSGNRGYEYDQGETQGHFIPSQSYIVEELQPRVKKGKGYARKYLAEEEAAARRRLESVENPVSSLEDIEACSVGTGSDANELLNEKLYEIKRELYGRKPRHNSRLIINDFKQQILSLIEANEVVVLTGPTGCGKTTQVPQYLLDSSMEKMRYCNIAVTQPRRIAAMTVARRVCDERKWELGKLCGFKVGLKDRTSPQTLLTFMTTGVLLQNLIKKRSLSQYTHIILDEIHERDQSMDFLLIVIRKLLNQVSNNTKVILMSATVKAERFANYFSKKYRGEDIPSPIITVDRRTNFKVDIFYLDDLTNVGEIPDVRFHDSRISEQAYDICVRLLKQFDRLDYGEDKKSVLIFLPGINEIEFMYYKLKDPNVYLSGKYKYRWSPLPLHSSITVEEQVEVFLPADPGYRKVILSTNVAESSITVPGVKYVIDFCLVKRMKNDPTTNFSGLQLCWASQASCIQRAGRVGRVMDGKVYRMVPRKFFEKLNKESTPEMLDAPLDRVILQSKMLDMGEPAALLALALDPPDLSDIEWTILILKEAGGLLRHRKGVYTPYDGDLTFLGRLMAILPVDIHISKLIAMGHIFGYLSDCIVMGASMSVKSVFSNPFRDRLKAYDLKRAWAESSFSDCIALLNVYNLWRQHKDTGYFERNREDGERRWANRNFIQIRVLREIHLLVEELKQRLKEFQIEEAGDRQELVWNDYEKTVLLKVAIAGAFYPQYYCPGYRHGDTCEQEAVKELGGENPFTTVVLHSFPHDQPMELYFGLIMNYFSTLGADVKLTSNGCSKILVEFRRRQSRMRLHGEDSYDEMPPATIPEVLFRALKTRHIKKYVNLKLLPAYIARRRAESLGLRGWRDNVNEKKRRPENFIPCPLPGLDVSYINIVISHVIDPGHFWALYADNLPIQDKILHTIMKYSSRCRSFETRPIPGMMCIAPLSTGRRTRFRRARIESVKENREDSVLYAEVFFIDEGCHRTINTRELRQYGPELAADLKEIPGQVFECVLHGIRPSSMMNLTGMWTKSAVSAFEKVIRGGKLFGEIYSVVRGVVSLELHKIDENNQDTNINEYLIDTKFAERADEYHFSKVNHALRRESLLSDYQKNMCSSLQEGEIWQTERVPYLREGDLTVNAQLKGPTSPLEMSIYPCTRGSMHKSVVVSDESVNSVLLNTEPWDRHERLIVAGSTTQNSTGTRLIINQTTLMPNIHGLPALIPFLFAPEIELRVNKDRTKYTGVLCGLGTDSDGHPLFPEHDMEIYFDSEITPKDFDLVNHLRYYMNLLLMADEYESYHTNTKIIKYQHKIRSLALKLFVKDRESVEVDFERKAHDWRRTPPDLVLSSAGVKAFTGQCPYPFHPGTSIYRRFY